MTGLHAIASYAWQVVSQVVQLSEEDTVDIEARFS